jgi:hypothetical protein
MIGVSMHAHADWQMGIEREGAKKKKKKKKQEHNMHRNHHTKEGARHVQSALL